ncbi:MAG TPA: hypothetical protein VK571_09045 [Gemmatimonadaceae bacterium]|nr:hypothetical protein [Gemmatimonadaceae bacterium]
MTEPTDDERRELAAAELGRLVLSAHGSFAPEVLERALELVRAACTRWPKQVARGVAEGQRPGGRERLDRAFLGWVDPEEGGDQ